MTSLSSFCSLDYGTNLPVDTGFATFFWYLYRNSLYTDVKFHVETADGLKEFHAHKLVLSMMSPYFAERFYKDGKPNKQVEEIIIRKVDPKAFEGMLRFIYSGRIIELESPNEACGLYQVAAKYKVTSLMKKCHQYVQQIEVEPSNVFTVLEVAEYMQNKSLTDRCFAVIQGRTREVMYSYALSDITTSMMHIILDLPALSLSSEYELLKWVFCWAKEKASRKVSHYNNIREVLQKFLRDMHFLLLSNVEFTEICRDYKGFFTAEEMVSIFMNIAIPGSEEMPDWYDKDCTLRIYPNQEAKSCSEKMKESSFVQIGNKDGESILFPE